VRGLGQPQVGAEFGEVLRQDDDDAVVGLVEGLQGREREELGLGEVMARARRSLGGQGRLRDGEGLAGDDPGGLGHRPGSFHA
jgi:hypothetical protein